MTRSLPRHVAAGLASSVAFLLTLAACGAIGAPPAAPHPPGALALVVGHRNNTPKPQLVGSHAQQVVADSIRSHDTLYLTGVSGDPRPLYTQPMTGDCDSPASCDALVTRYSTLIGQLMAQVRAETPEANTLEAIAVAARSVAGNPGPKHIIVIDNGLQTTGEMPLQGPGALSADPNRVAQTLADAGRLEKLLSGVDVTMIGLGDGHDPQPNLEQHKRDQLKTLWSTVLRKAGAADVFIEPAQLPDEPPGPGLPPVTVVPAADDPLPAIEPCTKLREDQVGFLPNQAAFRDPEEVRRVLGPIAQKIIGEKLSATLIGTTALPDSTGPGSLSNARAQAVKDVLVSLGVPEQSLTTVGVATNFRDYVDPSAPDGVFKETVAVRDRLVIVQLPGARC